MNANVLFVVYSVHERCGGELDIAARARESSAARRCLWEIKTRCHLDEICTANV